MNYPPDADPEIFTVADPPPMITPEIMDAVRAADERAARFYRENPNAAELDDQANEKIHRWARKAREEPEERGEGC